MGVNQTIFFAIDYINKNTNKWIKQNFYLFCIKRYGMPTTLATGVHI